MKWFFMIIVCLLSCICCVACTSSDQATPSVPDPLQHGGMVVQIDTTLPQDGTYKHPYRLEGQDGAISCIGTNWIIEIAPAASPFCVSPEIVSHLKNGEYILLHNLSGIPPYTQELQIVVFSTKDQEIRLGGGARRGA